MKRLRVAPTPFVKSLLFYDALQTKGASDTRTLLSLPEFFRLLFPLVKPGWHLLNPWQARTLFLRLLVDIGADFLREYPRNLIPQVLREIQTDIQRLLAWDVSAADLLAAGRGAPVRRERIELLAALLEAYETRIDGQQLADEMTAWRALARPPLARVPQMEVLLETPYPLPETFFHALRQLREAGVRIRVRGIRAVYEFARLPFRPSEEEAPRLQRVFIRTSGTTLALAETLLRDLAQEGRLLVAALPSDLNLLLRLLERAGLAPPEARLYLERSEQALRTVVDLYLHDFPRARLVPLLQHPQFQLQLGLREEQVQALLEASRKLPRRATLDDWRRFCLEAGATRLLGWLQNVHNICTETDPVALRRALLRALLPLLPVEPPDLQEVMETWESLLQLLDRLGVPNEDRASIAGALLRGALPSARHPSTGIAWSLAEEAFGHNISRVHIWDISLQTFPGHPPRRLFLPDAARASLNAYFSRRTPVLPDHREHWLYRRFLFAGLFLPAEEVLAYLPPSARTRTNQPSPFLKELQDQYRVEVRYEPVPTMRALTTWSPVAFSWDETRARALRGEEPRLQVPRLRVQPRKPLSTEDGRVPDPEDRIRLYGTASHPLSPTTLETYLRCPYRFFAQHILRLEELPPEYRVRYREIGRRIHALLRRVLEASDGHPSLALDALEEIWATERQNLELLLGEVGAEVLYRALVRLLSEDILERLRVAVREAIVKFWSQKGGRGVKKKRAELKENPPEMNVDLVGVEYPLHGTLGQVHLSGRADIILRVAPRGNTEIPAAYVILDYKWKVPMDRALVGRESLQLGLYAYLLSERIQGRRDLIFGDFVGIFGQRKVPQKPLLWRRSSAELVRLILRPLEHLQEGRFPATRNYPFFRETFTLESRWDCRFCPFMDLCRIREVEGLERSWLPGA